MLGLIMMLLLMQGLYDGWARFQDNEKAKAFRNEMRRDLDKVENVPEVVRSEME